MLHQTTSNIEKKIHKIELNQKPINPLHSKPVSLVELATPDSDRS